MKIISDSLSDRLAKFYKGGKNMSSDRIEEMKSQQMEYFGDRKKQVETFSNLLISEQSEQRRNKLAELYANVPEADERPKGVYVDYLKDLEEIQMYISNNLTFDGVKAITPGTKKTGEDLEGLRVSLKPLISALDEIEAEFSMACFMIGP